MSIAESDLIRVGGFGRAEFMPALRSLIEDRYVSAFELENDRPAPDNAESGRTTYYEISTEGLDKFEHGSASAAHSISERGSIRPLLKLYLVAALVPVVMIFVFRRTSLYAATLPLMLGVSVGVSILGLVIAVVGLRAADARAVAVGVLAPVLTGMLLMAWMLRVRVPNLAVVQYALVIPLAAAVLLRMRPLPLIFHESAQRRRIHLIRLVTKLQLAWPILAWPVLFALYEAYVPSDAVLLAYWSVLALPLVLSGIGAGVLGVRIAYRQAIAMGIVALAVAVVWANSVFAIQLETEPAALYRHNSLLLAPMSLLAIVAAAVWLIVTSPKVRRVSDASAGLADLLRDCLQDHEPYRLRYRMYRALVPLTDRGWSLLTLIVLGWLVGRFIGRTQQNMSISILVALVIWAFLSAPIGDGLKKRSRLRHGYRTVRHRGRELFLIDLVETKRAFGLYLRPFAPSGDRWPRLDEMGRPGSVDRMLAGFDAIPFFALDNTRRDVAPLLIHEVWVPDADWQRAAFALIREAAAIIFNFESGRPALQGGLLEELRFAVDSGLAHKCILIVPWSTPPGDAEAQTAKLLRACAHQIRSHEMEHARGLLMSILVHTSPQDSATDHA
jgi:hypothetical protein